VKIKRGKANEDDNILDPLSMTLFIQSKQGRIGLISCIKYMHLDVFAVLTSK